MKRKRTRGTGTIFRPTYTDKKTGEIKTASKLWIQYYHPDTGKHLKEPVGSSNESEAEKMLRRRLDALERGESVSPQYERTTLDDLATIVVDDYKFNGHRTTNRLRSRLNHLIGDEFGFFGRNVKARTITADRIVAYVAHRRDKGAKNGTINRELSCLHRAFELARRAGRVARVPDIVMLKENNTREGFFELDQHQAMMAVLPSYLADVCEFLYWTGWRSGEALALNWTNIDERVRIMRIEHTKNGKPRTFPYGWLPALADLIAKRAEIRDVMRAQGRIVPHVFHNDGQAIRPFHYEWGKACVAAGLGHVERKPDRVLKNGTTKPGGFKRWLPMRIVHDYRRTAARNMSRANVSERVIMDLCGWDTREVFDRYRIVCERDLADGLERYAQGATRDGAGQREQIARTLSNAGIPERLIQELVERLAASDAPQLARVTTFPKK
jgi:integrase